MRHLKFYKSFSLFRPSLLIYMGELPQLITQLQSYRKEAAENLNKKESGQKKPTFTLAQLRQLREKFEAEYRPAGLASEKMQEKMKIIDERLRLPEAYVLNLDKVAAEIRKTAEEDLLAEISLDSGSQIKVADRAKYHQEIEVWIRENIPDFEDNDSGDQWYTNKTRQALHGFLLGAHLAMSDKEFADLQKTVKDKYERFQMGSRFDWEHFESLKLFEDNTDNAGHARDWWLYSETNGLKSIGLELVGYEDEGYLTAFLMSAEKFFNKTIGGDEKKDLGEQFYQAYKANMIGILTEHKSELQKLGGINTDLAHMAAAPWVSRSVNYDNFIQYKENYEAQMKIIHENIPTPQEWFEALKGIQSEQEKPSVFGPGSLVPPTLPPGPPGGDAAPQPGATGVMSSLNRSDNVSGGLEKPPESDPVLTRYISEIFLPYTLHTAIALYLYPFAYEMKKPELLKFPKTERLLITGTEALKHKKFGDAMDAGRNIDEAKTEFATQIGSILADFQTEMPKRYEAVKDKLTPEQSLQLEQILKKLSEFQLGNFQFKPEYYSTLAEFRVLYCELQKAGAASVAGIPGAPGKSPSDDGGGDKDAGTGGKTGDATGGGEKASEKPKEEGPNADEIRAEAAEYCTLDNYYRVSFSSEKAEKVLRLHDRFSPDNGNVLMVIPAADIARARLARFDSEDKRYEYSDGKPAKFMKGYQVLQGWNDMEIVGRYEAALTFDMPREIDGAAKYIGKRYEKLLGLVENGFDSKVALALLETMMVRLDRLLKNAKRDSYRLDLVPNFSVEWRNPGPGGSGRLGYELDDFVRVGYVFGVGRAPEAGSTDAGFEKNPLGSGDNMVLPNLDEGPQEPEKTPEGLPENEKSRLQEAFSDTLKNFVRLVREGALTSDDKAAYQKWLVIGDQLQAFKKSLETTLRKYHEQGLELSVPKVDAVYGPKAPEKIMLEESHNTSMSLRDFAYYAGMIDDSKSDSPFYKFIERVDRYMAEFKKE